MNPDPIPKKSTFLSSTSRGVALPGPLRDLLRLAGFGDLCAIQGGPGPLRGLVHVLGIALDFVHHSQLSGRHDRWWPGDFFAYYFYFWESDTQLHV